MLQLPDTTHNVNTLRLVKSLDHWEKCDQLRLTMVEYLVQILPHWGQLP